MCGPRSTSPSCSRQPPAACSRRATSGSWSACWASRWSSFPGSGWCTSAEAGGWSGGWHRGSYALFLVYGFLTAADHRIGRAFGRQWRTAMALGGLLLVACGAVFAAASTRGDPLTDMEPLAMAFRLLKSLDGLLWVIAILGLASSCVARPGRSSAPGRATAVRRLGAYLNDAVLPFYVLHETVVVMTAYLILALELAPSVQYLLISSASLVLTLLLTSSVSAAARSPVCCSASSPLDQRMTAVPAGQPSRSWSSRPVTQAA